MSTEEEVKAKRQAQYRRSRERYQTLLPVDYALLELLPDEGKMIGYKHIALQVRSIKDAHEGFEEFSGSQLAGRLKAMATMGYTVSQVVLPLQRGLGWQRTAAGRRILEQNGKVVT